VFPPHSRSPDTSPIESISERIRKINDMFVISHSAVCPGCHIQHEFAQALDSTATLSPEWQVQVGGKWVRANAMHGVRR
jgi:hypothetical protein